MDDGCLVIIAGKSASGKDTTAKALVKALNDMGKPAHRVISATTRPMRTGEEDGVDYHFMSDKEFLNGVWNDRFLETSVFRGWAYGTPRSDVPRGYIDVAVLNPEGIRSVVSRVRRNANVYVYYLDVPFHTRLWRSIKREHRFKLEFIRRARTDRRDFRDYDYGWAQCSLNSLGRSIDFFHEVRVTHLAGKRSIEDTCLTIMMDLARRLG